MSITRRRFLQHSAAALVAGACSADRHQAGQFLSAATTTSGQHIMVGVDANGDVMFRTPIDFRGHEVAVSPDQSTAVVIARRPRTSLAQIDLSDGRLVDRVEADPGRHFYGHGVFTDDGRHLLTTENDYERERGAVVVRDTATLAVVDEFDSFGVGPHEMRWLSDRKTLVIANGGIVTHPSHGRAKRKVDSMRPNLAFVDAAAGQLIRRLEPDYRTNSVRHIDLLSDDRVVVAMQQEGKAAADQLLVAVADQQMRSVAMPEANLRELAQYTASVCVDRRSGNALVTCPRGNRVSFWSGAEQAYKGSQRIADAAGVCVDELSGEFVVTTGRGMIHRFDARTFQASGDPVRTPGLSWDNHVTYVNVA